MSESVRLWTSNRNADGSDLTKERELISDSQLEEAKKSKKAAQDEFNERAAGERDANGFLVGGGWDLDDPAEKKHRDSLVAKMEAADAVINDAKNNKSMSLKEQSEVLSQQKVDSQLGQALGIQANTAAGVNYAQNAKYGEESQQQSIKAKLDAQGGVEGAVHVDVVDAQVKAKTQQNVLDAQLKEGGAKDGLKSSADDLSKAADKLAQTTGTLAGVKTASDIVDVDAKKDAKILDNEGSFTKDGRSAISIRAGEDANSMMGKVKIGKNTQKIVDSVRAQAYKNAMVKHNNNSEKANAEADATVAPYVGADGKALTGQEFWNKQAELKAGSFSGSNSMLFGDGKVFSGGLSSDGAVTGTLSSGLSGKHDETTNHSQGYKVTTNSYEPESVKAREALDYMEHATNPIKAAQKLIANAGDEGAELNQFLQDNGYDTGLTNDQASNYTAIGAEVVGTALGATIVNQAPKMIGSKRTLWNMADDLVSGTKDSEATQKTSENTQSENNKKTFDEPHKTPPENNGKGGTSSSESSITKNGETSKFISDGVGGTKPNPDYVKPSGSTTKEPKSFMGEVMDGFKNSSLLKHKVGTALSVAAPVVAVAGTAYGLSGTDAEASTIKPLVSGATPPPKASTSNDGFSVQNMVSASLDTAAVGFNAFTGYMGMNEMKDGVKANALMKDATMGVKASGGLGKFALKKLPLVGLGLGMSAAYSRAQDGDYTGAGLEALSGIASMAPGLGTMASAAIDTGLIARDRFSSSVPQHAQNAFHSQSGANTGVAIQKDFNSGKVVPFAESSAVAQQSGPIAMPATLTIAPILATIDTSAISTSLANTLSTLSSSSIVGTGAQAAESQSGKMINSINNDSVGVSSSYQILKFL